MRVKWPGRWAWEHSNDKEGFFFSRGALFIILSTTDKMVLVLTSRGIFETSKRDIEELV